MRVHPRFASGTILAKGVLDALLGIVHVIVAFTFEARKIAGQGTVELQRDYIVWFLGVGLFILFTGLVDMFCYEGLKARSNLAWKISLLSALFTLIPGLAGVALYGVSPPLVLLVTGAVGTLVLALSKNGFQAR